VRSGGSTPIERGRDGLVIRHPLEHQTWLMPTIEMSGSISRVSARSGTGSVGGFAAAAYRLPRAAKPSATAAFRKCLSKTAMVWMDGSARRAAIAHASWTAS
jgi:hypothetical protein